MRASLTNRALGVGGDANTTSVTVRLPDPVVEFMDSHFDGRIKNRSEFLQHWAQVGVRVSLSDELTEALDWALQDPAGEPDGQAPACKAEEPGSTPGPASDPTTDAIEWARGLDPRQAVAGLEEERVNFQVAMGGEPLALGNVDPELVEVYGDILEKLRSRVR